MDAPGHPLSVCPSKPDWSAESVDGLVSYRPLFQRALQTFVDEASTAAIPVEAISAEVLLIAGGDDALWPSLDFAHSIVRRRKDAGKSPAWFRRLTPATGFSCRVKTRRARDCMRMAAMMSPMQIWA